MKVSDLFADKRFLKYRAPGYEFVVPKSAEKEICRCAEYGIPVRTKEFEKWVVDKGPYRMSTSGDTLVIRFARKESAMMAKLTFM